MYAQNNSTQKIYSSKTNIDRFIPRLRIGNHEYPHTDWWSTSTWYYNLTWMNATVYQGPTGSEVSTYFTGATLWTYAQTMYEVSTIQNVIYFSTLGVGSSTLGFDKFGIHVQITIETRGWIDTYSHQGSLIVWDYL